MSSPCKGQLANMALTLSAGMWEGHSVTCYKSQRVRGQCMWEMYSFEKRALICNNSARRYRKLHNTNNRSSENTMQFMKLLCMILKWESSDRQCKQNH
jgi:hypothetical protein